MQSNVFRWQLIYRRLLVGSFNTRNKNLHKSCFGKTSSVGNQEGRTGDTGQQWGVPAWRRRGPGFDPQRHQNQNQTRTKPGKILMLMTAISETVMRWHTSLCSTWPGEGGTSSQLLNWCLLLDTVHRPLQCHQLNLCFHRRHSSPKENKGKRVIWC